MKCDAASALDVEEIDIKEGIFDVEKFKPLTSESSIEIDLLAGKTLLFCTRGQRVDRILVACRRSA